MPGTPIGSQPLSHYLGLITSQYQNSPNFLAFVQAMLAKLGDASACLAAMPAAFDLDTAVGVQLDTLGVIVGANRQLPFTPGGGPPPPPDPITGVILATTFNEGSAGTDIGGTSPATLAGPAIGATWRYDQAAPWNFHSGGGAIGTGAVGSPYSNVSIDCGSADCTINASITPGGSSSIFIFRMVDASHFIFFNCSSGQVVEQVGSGQTVLGTYAGMDLNSLTLTLNGTSLVVSDDLGHTYSMTLPGDATLTASRMGMATYAGSGCIVNSLSVTATYTPAGGGGGGGGAASSILGDDDYRVLIKARIGFNEWNGEIDALQPIWKRIFPGGTIAIQDGQNMSATVILAGAFTDLVQQMIVNGMIVPRPAGVLYNYTFAALPVFGFDSNTDYVAGFDVGKWS